MNISRKRNSREHIEDFIKIENVLDCLYDVFGITVPEKNIVDNLTSYTIKTNIHCLHFLTLKEKHNVLDNVEYKTSPENRVLVVIKKEIMNSYFRDSLFYSLSSLFLILHLFIYTNITESSRI